MTAKLVWITPDAEKTMIYCARVSSKNQTNPEYAGLLKHCLKSGHWSVFEMASACIEIRTTRSISAQILRHRSFSFQEFSQRYSDDIAVEIQSGRKQAEKNRQCSAGDLELADAEWWSVAQERAYDMALTTYREALARGVARECARAVLPLATSTRLYVSGTVRSWITYLRARLAHDAQEEHRVIARECAQLLSAHLPLIAQLEEWPS